MKPALDATRSDVHGRDLQLKLDPQANLPIYAQIRQQLTWWIASGRLPPHSRLPNIRELAGRHNINMHTVRQAYHALEADGLVESRPGRGTHVLPVDVGQLASRTASPPSHTVGVLLPEPSSLYAQFLGGLEGAAKSQGYLLITGFTHDSAAGTLGLAQRLVSKDIDGLIGASTAGHLQPEQMQGLPVVYVDSPEIRRNSIVLNLEGAGHEATRHLIWHGHRAIALITASLEWHNNRHTLRGYKRALREAGLPVEEGLMVEVPAFLRQFGYQGAKRLLELRRGRPTAIFVSGDILAMGALQAIREAGLRVPQDIAVASKDNVEFASLTEPSLTTVSLPFFAAGAESMKMLQSLISGHEQVGRRQLRGEKLIVRRSCGCSGADE
jgi:DNA-binding LacI/PurR family transcriptional regulator